MLNNIDSHINYGCVAQFIEAFGFCNISVSVRFPYMMYIADLL